MSVKKEKALADLNKEFESYSNLLLKQLRLLETIIETDGGTVSDEHFNEIKKNEKEIDKFEVKLSDDIINIIVLYNPMAAELRLLMAMYRTSLNVEKIGDMVANIIRNIKKADDVKAFQNHTEAILDILIISINMVEKSLLALRNNDMDYAVWTIKNDDVVDELHRSFAKRITKKQLPNVKSQSEIKTFINLLNIVSYIERIGDNATNIAEAAIYSSMGKDVRHKHVNIDSIS
ncbi:phosphate signaling complex PhoU family protein [Natronoflexus pectinivorans]|uniref:Phosphate transport system protein n=1 Tax=Natronoflexus pectinivorans TaxID=682526 RepID=A0A4R2GNZ8_9BACT|nr:phosphate uptake regulator PhoU [Natronoflexus pectinivorans]TCO10830.1 phosphate transport system protein [Natronoflexus pectinivorans]